MSLVFDSSAMLAYLRGEDGCEMVGNFLEDADVGNFAHAVNICEVHYDYLRRGSHLRADDAIRDLLLLGIIEHDDMDVAFRRDLAFLIAHFRTHNFRLALGDAFGVALARRLDADFVTGDRHEIERLATAGVCRVTFIR